MESRWRKGWKRGWRKRRRERRGKKVMESRWRRCHGVKDEKEK